MSMGGHFGPYLVDNQQRGWHLSIGGGGKAKVWLLAKPLELLFYFVPLSKAAK